MKTYLFRLFLLMALVGFVSPASFAKDDRELIPRPTPPDTMLNLQPRCDYIIARFWDRTNLEQAFLHPEELNQAFGEWVAIMPHASADTVHSSIQRLIAKTAKSGPSTLKLAELAEAWLYSDSSEYHSTEVYLPFAKAAASHKKISKVEKARFAQQVGVIQSSSTGSLVPNFTLIKPDGSKINFNDISGTSILLFINDPDCDDCSLARVRLSADYNTNQLIEKGELTVVSIYPGEANDKSWKEAAASYPSNWVVGALPTADMYFDMRQMPQFIFLNKDHKVLLRDVPVDHYLGAFRTATTKSQRN